MKTCSHSAAHAVADSSPPANSAVEVVIVDASCDRYGDFVEAAQAGGIGLHFCADGSSAVRLARRFRADVWLIAAELPDVSGFDLLEMLMPIVLQGDVDPLIDGARLSLGRVGEGRRTGVFVVTDAYRLEDEQRALASGVAGYLVGPVTPDVIEAVTGRCLVDGERRSAAHGFSASCPASDSTPTAARSET